MTNRLVLLLVLGQSLNVAAMRMEDDALPTPTRQHARCMRVNPTTNMLPSVIGKKRRETTPVESQTSKRIKMGRPSTPKSKENLIPEFELGAAHDQTPDEPMCLPVTPPAKSPVQPTAAATMQSNQTALQLMIDESHDVLRIRKPVSQHNGIQLPRSQSCPAISRMQDDGNFWRTSSSPEEDSSDDEEWLPYDGGSPFVAPEEFTDLNDFYHDDQEEFLNDDPEIIGPITSYAHTSRNQPNTQSNRQNPGGLERIKEAAKQINPKPRRTLLGNTSDDKDVETFLCPMPLLKK